VNTLSIVGQSKLEALSGFSPYELETLFPSQISAPSDKNGIAKFDSLQFVDAIDGDYKVVFYFADDPRNGIEVFEDAIFTVYDSIFRQKFTLGDAIGSHACSLQANMRVTNCVPLGSSLSYQLTL
jgi:hypothetical protein